MQTDKTKTPKRKPSTYLYARMTQAEANKLAKYLKKHNLTRVGWISAQVNSLEV